MKKTKLRDSNNYKSFGIYLTRNKIESAYSVASLFIDKFAKSRKPSDWQIVTADDLKHKNILPSKKHTTFSHWRDEMIKNRFLICMATKEELQEKNPNHKGSMFKFGDRIKKYIDQAIQESLPKKVEDIDSKLDDMSDKFNIVNENVSNVNDKVDRLESEVKVLKENINNLTSIVLEAFPPDTPIRRKIVQDNINNKEACLKLLAKEVEKSIEENGRMFHN